MTGENMPTSFIKLDRNLLNWRWFQDRNTLQLWTYLLMAANIKPRDFKNITINRGELATSYPSLSAATGQTVKEIRTALDHLKSTGEVAVTRYSKFSVISVKNYDLYQGSGQAKGSQTADNGQAKGTNQRMKEYKECKNVCVRDENAHPHGRLQNVFLTDEEYELYKNVPDIDAIIDELSEAIDTNPTKYRDGHTTSWLNKFIRAKRQVKKEPEKRKMLK